MTLSTVAVIAIRRQPEGLKRRALAQQNESVKGNPQMWKNTSSAYGRISKLLHWLSALTVIGLFGLGLWMVELTYYDDWYRKGPDLHRSTGILLMLAMLARLLWLVWAGKPRPLPSHRPWEVCLAHCTHIALYGVVFAMGVTGYLISTADGRAVAVFDWFSIPSSGEWVDNQEDVAGEVHEWLAYTLIAMVVVHAAAAIKHHILDRDETLKRML